MHYPNTDIEDKKYDAIDKKYVRQRCRFSEKNTQGNRIRSWWKKLQKKEMPMTINDNKILTPYDLLVEQASAKFSYISLRYLPGISRISPTSKSTCRVCLRLWALFPWGGGGLKYKNNPQGISSLPRANLYTPRANFVRTINRNQSGSERTIPARTETF